MVKIEERFLTSQTPFEMTMPGSCIPNCNLAGILRLSLRLKGGMRGALDRTYH
jgi:hypothetical protein